METLENPIEKTRKIIAENKYLTLATGCENDIWIAGLAYAVDKEYHFFFYSAKNSRHAMHIEKNPNVAFSIYNSTLPTEEVDGLQFSGTVSEVSLFELPHVISLYYEQSFPDEVVRQAWRQPLEAFKGLAIKRFYKIVPTHVYKIDLSIIEVDLRFEVDLEELRKVPAK